MTAKLESRSRSRCIEWRISAHAAARYRERIDGSVSHEVALQILLWHCQRAHYVKMLPSGVEYWRGPKRDPWGNVRRLRLRVSRGYGRMELQSVLGTFDP